MQAAHEEEHVSDHAQIEWNIQFNSIYYINTTGINTVVKLRSNKQYVPIVFHALIISWAL